MKILVIFITALAAGQTITWVQQTPNGTWTPLGTTGFSSAHTNPVNGRILIPSVPQGSNSIYVSHWPEYDPTTNNFALLNSDGSASTWQGCTPNKPNQPGNRHPYLQMAFDPVRNWFWIGEGANQGCSNYTVNTSGATVTVTTSNEFTAAFAGEVVTIAGTDYTVVSVTDETHLELNMSAGTQDGVALVINSRVVSGNTKPDLYHMPAGVEGPDQWTQESPGAFPSSQAGAGRMWAFDHDSDVLFVIGPGLSNHWVYCYLGEGSLTAAQTAAGCSSPNAFVPVTPLNGVVHTSGATVTKVSGDDLTILTAGDLINIFGTFYVVQSVESSTSLTLTGSAGAQSNRNWYTQTPSTTQGYMHYDPVTQRVIQFGGTNQADTVKYNQTWSYNIGLRKWRRKALSTTPPAAEDFTGYPMPAIGYSTSDSKYYYHWMGHATPADWAYDPVADTWTLMTSVGTGETQNLGAQAGWSPLCNCLVTFASSAVGGTGQPYRIFVGTITDARAVSGGAGVLSGSGKR